MDECDRLQLKVALREEEIRIKDARMLRISSHKRERSKYCDERFALRTTQA